MGVNLLRPFIGSDNQAHFTKVRSGFQVPKKVESKKPSRPSKAKRERAKQKFHQTVSSNVQNLKAIKASGHSATGTTAGRNFSTGYRTSPDPRQGYVFRGATNIAQMDNTGHDKGFSKPV